MDSELSNNEQNTTGYATMKIAGTVFLCFIFIYAAASLGLIIQRNSAGAVSLMYLSFFTLFIIFLKKSVNLLEAIICVIPAFNVYYELISIKIVLLLLPILVLFYFKHIRDGIKAIVGLNKKILVACVLMLTGLLLSLSNAFVRGTFDREMLVQVSLLSFEIVVMALVVVSINTKEKFIAILNTLLVPALALVILVIVYSLFSNIWVILYSVKGKNFEIGDRLIHANLVAMIIMPIMIATFPEIMRKKFGFSFMVYIIMFPIAIVALILTSSRGSWVGFMSGMGYLFLRLKKIKYIVVVVFIVLIVGLVLSGYVVRRYSQTNKFDGAILERLVLWRAAIKYITSNPLMGLGPNYFRIEKYKLGVPANAGPANAYSTHNIILEIFVNYGFFALLGFVTVIAYILYANNKLIGSVVKQNSLYYLSINAALISTLVHSMFDCNIANIAYMTVFSVLLGLSMTLVSKESSFMKT